MATTSDPGIDPPRSTLTHLDGSESGRRYDADRLMGCDPHDDRPLLARYDLERAGRTLTVDALRRRPRGMWRWGELLPVRDRGRIVSLGEGDTALFGATRLGAHLGLRRLDIKADGHNPTGSFKARGMAAAVSRNTELGARSFISPSAGNAAGALAAYGAAAGAPVIVLMPVDAPAANQLEVLACGAALLLVEGLISDCGRLAGRVAAATGAFDLSTLKEPYRVEGKKTMGLELAEQCGWELPDVVVYPTGGGTGLVGMWKAFDELETLGLIGGGRPRMVSAQAAGCAPIVKAFAGGERTAEPWVDARTRAAGLRVPSAVGDTLILDALRASSGTAVAVPEGDIDTIQLDAGRLGLGYVSAETAAAVAATAQLRSDGWIEPGERVVVFDTGMGHKSPPPTNLPSPPVVNPSNVEDAQLLALLDIPTAPP